MARKSQGPSGVNLKIANDLMQMVERGDELTKARDCIFNSPFLEAYRCKIGSKAKSGAYSPLGLPLIDLVSSDDGRKVIDTSMQAVISVARGLNWKSANQNQRDLAAAAGFLMDSMGYAVDPEIKSLATEHAANFRSGGSESSSSTRAPADVLDDGCRYLYLVEVPNAPVFKLGTLKADHSRGRKTVLDRFLNRNDPALPTCCDVKWDPTKLVIKHVVKTVLEPQDPDVPIHEQLRAAAKEDGLLNCGKTEFHDRALLKTCRDLMNAQRDDQADVLADVSADIEAASEKAWISRYMTDGKVLQ
jgi:hypothetical protein